MRLKENGWSQTCDVDVSVPGAVDVEVPKEQAAERRRMFKTACTEIIM